MRIRRLRKAAVLLAAPIALAATLGVSADAQAAASSAAPLTAACHLNPEAQASLAFTGLEGRTAKELCSMPGAEPAAASKEPVSSASPDLVEDCGSVILLLFNAPKEGKGWASFHLDVTMNGRFGLIDSGDGVITWENYDTGAKGKPTIAITNDKPDPTTFEGYQNKYTQDGTVAAVVSTAIETTTGDICVGEAATAENITS